MESTRVQPRQPKKRREAPKSRDELIHEMTGTFFQMMQENNLPVGLSGEHTDFNLTHAVEAAFSQRVNNPGRSTHEVDRAIFSALSLHLEKLREAKGDELKIPEQVDEESITHSANMVYNSERQGVHLAAA